MLSYDELLEWFLGYDSEKVCWKTVNLSAEPHGRLSRLLLHSYRSCPTSAHS